VHRRDHRSSRGRRLSHAPPLCRWSVPRRNRDPSPFFSCAAATRPATDNVVADPHVSARHAESFGSARGPAANTPADCAWRNPARSTPGLAHTGDKHRFAARNAGNRTPEPPPAPTSRPPTGRWTAPGRAGIKALLNGSPPSNRNGRGPGVRWPIEARALAYLDRSHAPAATLARRHLQRLSGISPGTKARSDADASEAPSSIHAHAGVFAAVGLLAKISPVYFSRARQD
jgi:hypothetical protein